MAHPKIKLTYFQLPGLAEPSRLLLTIAGIPFEDVRFTPAEWPEIKPTSPFGQAPWAEVDGKPLAQSGAIERYFARLAGMMPEDAWEAALADQAVFLARDVIDTLSPTYRIADLEERIKARQKVVAEVFPQRLGQLTALLEANGGQHFAGTKLSFADINVFVFLSTMISGQLDGMPKDLLDSYPVLKAFRNQIASLPAIKAYYEPHTEGVRAAFRPDDAK